MSMHRLLVWTTQPVSWPWFSVHRLLLYGHSPWFSLCLDLVVWGWFYSLCFWFPVLFLKLCSLCLHLFLMCFTCVQSSCLPLVYKSPCFPLFVLFPLSSCSSGPFLFQSCFPDISCFLVFLSVFLFLELLIIYIYVPVLKEIFCYLFWLLRLGHPVFLIPDRMSHISLKTSSWCCWVSPNEALKVKLKFILTLTSKLLSKLCKANNDFHMITTVSSEWSVTSWFCNNVYSLYWLCDRRMTLRHKFFILDLIKTVFLFWV